MTDVVVATDDFNRAGPAIGANYEQLWAFNGTVVIVSNHTEGTGQGNVARWIGAGTFTDDQFARGIVVFGNLGSSLYMCGVLARCSGDLDDGATSTRDFYEFTVYDTGGHPAELAKTINGVRTVLDTAASTSIANADEIEIRCVDDQIEGLHEGVVILSATDSSLTSGKPGLLASELNGFDSLELGNITSSASYSLTCNNGSYSLNGQNAALVEGNLLVALQGSYALNGQASILRHGYKIVFASGNYSYTGQAAAADYQLTCVNGSYALNGQTSVLRHGYKLLSAQGSYALNGQAASLIAGKGLLAQQGSYSLTGQAAVFSNQRLLVLGQGSYSLNGQNVSLNASSSLALSADFGSYSLNGSVCNFRVGFKLEADSGQYLLTGRQNGMSIGRKILLASGSYSLNGNELQLLSDTQKMLQAEFGFYSLNGQAVSLLKSGERSIQMESGIYSLAGFSIGLTHRTWTFAYPRFRTEPFFE